MIFHARQHVMFCASQLSSRRLFVSVCLSIHHTLLLSKRRKTVLTRITKIFTVGCSGNFRSGPGGHRPSSFAPGPPVSWPPIIFTRDSRMLRVS